MPVFALTDAMRFPPADLAAPSGLLAVGGDLQPERLLLAYRQGIFPWYEEGLPILWHSPDPRMVLTPGELHVARSLRRTLRRQRFELRADTAFRQVMESCASVDRPGQSGTWITPEMIDAYHRLHDMGFAHSIETWRDGELVGGVYGVSLGAAFFGESMFTRVTDASKVAFVTLVRQIRRWGFRMLDGQVYTDHVARFGARLWAREDFLRELERALEHPTRHGPWELDADLAVPPAREP